MRYVNDDADDVFVMYLTFNLDHIGFRYKENIAITLFDRLGEGLCKGNASPKLKDIKLNKNEETLHS